MLSFLDYCEIIVVTVVVSVGDGGGSDNGNDSHQSDTLILVFRCANSHILNLCDKSHNFLSPCRIL